MNSHGTDSSRTGGYDYVEFYVGSARMAAYWYARTMGMSMAAYSGPETGVRDRASYLVSKNDLRIVLTSPLTPECREVTDFLNLHGDGVKRWAIQVKDVEQACRRALAGGAILVDPPRRLEDEGGVVVEASLKIYDDTEVVLSDRSGYEGLFKPGFGKPLQNVPLHAEETGLLGIDHIVGNSRGGEMDRWANYLNKALGFSTYVEFKAGDIGTRYSALLSKVVRSADHRIKNPINEPYPGLKKSQIEEYLEEYRGSGVQHIAIATGDILSTISALRKNGMVFLEVPDSYYHNLARRSDLKIRENIEDLKRLRILCDWEGDGYLLQLFTKPVGDRPTFFFEFIQRVGNSQGFGKGNFQALFEAIEWDQQKRGNLVSSGSGSDAGSDAGYHRSRL